MSIFRIKKRSQFSDQLKLYIFTSADVVVNRIAAGKLAAVIWNLSCKYPLSEVVYPIARKLSSGSFQTILWQGRHISSFCWSPKKISMTEPGKVIFHTTLFIFLIFHIWLLFVITNSKVDGFSLRSLADVGLPFLTTEARMPLLICSYILPFLIRDVVALVCALFGLVGKFDFICNDIFLH